MQVGLDTYVPVIFGVLTVMNKEQAIVRSVGTYFQIYLLVIFLFFYLRLDKSFSLVIHSFPHCRQVI